ncbi:MAG: hypothetical protein M3Z25_08235 [Actinomycetota bacterium]|nr:hypothetical protein [Actinomycetota bacterium]
MPDLSPRMVLRALARTCYDVEREREAETIATTIMAWTNGCFGEPDRASEGGPLGRLANALGNNRWRG